jgi:hypothetical protein
MASTFQVRILDLVAAFREKACHKPTFDGPGLTPVLRGVIRAVRRGDDQQGIGVDGKDVGGGRVATEGQIVAI